MYFVHQQKVLDKIDNVASDEEDIEASTHGDNKIFTHLIDQQLVSWLNRFVIIAFSCEFKCKK